MVGQDVYLRTRQVADALGISVSTLKRWVDGGQIEATRTVGRHRLIALAEALRFARQSRLATAGLLAMAGSGGLSLVAVDDAVRDALCDALKAGRAGEARRLIVAAHAALGSAAALADDLIGPVMERVGHGWSEGTLDVFQEHEASQIISAAVVDLIARAGRGGDAPAPLALGASPEGDLYTLGGLLGELTLREVGWDVRYLGPDLPLRSLARAVVAYQPRLVYLAVSHLADPITFVEDYRLFSETARASGAAVILGGRGLRAEVRTRLDHDGHGDRMADLAEMGRRLSPTVHPLATNHGDPTGDRPGPDARSIN